MQERIDALAPLSDDNHDPFAEWLESLDHLVSEPIRERRWLVEGILPAESFIILAGNPKEGKSMFAQAVALACATGASMFGDLRITEPCNVLYIQNESTRYELARRFR